MQLARRVSAAQLRHCLQVLEFSAPIFMSVFRYTPEQLQALRPLQRPCVTRVTARRLKYFRIFVRHICVRVTALLIREDFEKKPQDRR